MEAELYQEGHPEFSKEYRQYQEICRQLEVSGIPLASARRLERDFQAESEKLEDARRAAWKEKRIARRLEEKVYRKKERQKTRSDSKRSNKGFSGKVR